MKPKLFSLDDTTIKTIDDLASERSGAQEGRSSAKSSVVRDLAAFADANRALFVAFVATRRQTATSGDTSIVAVS